MPHATRAPLVLCILDGWGLDRAGPANAIHLANTPLWDRLISNASSCALATSGEAVGLPCGQMGNSEVGHMTMGAGRIFVQDLPRIDSAIRDGSLARRPVLDDFIQRMRQSGGRCHLAGLLSPGGVHSHQNHIAELANIISANGVPVVIHAFLDGRDTPPVSSEEFVAKFLADAPQAQFATVIGRSLAMDRDRRWDRVEKAWHCIVDARGTNDANVNEAISAARDANESDEFVTPRTIGTYQGIRAGDGFLMANFRADRVRQLLCSLLAAEFEAFPRTRMPEFAAAAGMVSYSDDLDRLMPAIFESHHVSMTLGHLVADAGMRQLRIAETEKYAHVTYFFNGGREQVFSGEERILVPSPRVATYDQKPEMSAFEMTGKLVSEIRRQSFDLTVCNFANPDMVGHTGVLPAAIRAVEAVDDCLGQITAAVGDVGGQLVICADHGNIETMRDPQTGNVHTAHTTNPVPLVLYNSNRKLQSGTGGLSDLAPTLLDLMGMKKPAQMTGRSLLAGKI